MSVSVQVVVASRELERRREITSILVNLGLDPICVSSVGQCRELLSREPVHLIFCDRFLADGDYHDVLTVSRTSKSQPLLVLACYHNNADYHQAVAEGVFGVIATPCRSTEVEWMLIQAKRKERQRSPGDDATGTTELSPPRKLSIKDASRP